MVETITSLSRWKMYVAQLVEREAINFLVVGSIPIIYSNVKTEMAFGLAGSNPAFGTNGKFVKKRQKAVLTAVG